MLALTQSTEVDPVASIDEGLSPLLELAESAAANHSRLPVLSLWRQLPFVSLFAAHLHLRWPGEVKSLPLSPRIGIFPFFASDLDLLSRPLYQVQKARLMRQTARAKRFLSSPKSKGELYPDWEQAVDRWRQRLKTRESQDYRKTSTSRGASTAVAGTCASGSYSQDGSNL